MRKFLILGLGLLLFAGCATSKTVTKSADEYFKEGEDFYTRGLYEDAVAQWRKVKESYANPELSALVELKIADAQFKAESYIEAAASYEDFRKLHPTHEQAPFALYRLALCHFNQIGRVDTDQTPVKNAIVYLEQFLRQYPQSEYATEVKEKLELCHTKEIEYELYVGLFYLRTDKYQAAIGRLEGAFRSSPNSPLHDETLYYLGTAYLRAGDRAKGRETFTRLFNEYRDSKYVAKAQKAMEKYY